MGEEGEHGGCFPVSCVSCQGYHQQDKSKLSYVAIGLCIPSVITTNEMNKISSNDDIKRVTQVFVLPLIT